MAVGELAVVYGCASAAAGCIWQSGGGRVGDFLELVCGSLSNCAGEESELVKEGRRGNW